MLLGYIDPQRFLNGAMTLDTGNTARLFREQVAEPLDLPLEQAAIGIFRVANAQVTDLVHKITVEQGLDPRDFVLHAFGGTCPILASAFARELSVKRIIVPYTASVNCAFGLASTDVMHDFSVTLTRSVPCPAGEINAIFEPVIGTARQALEQEGFPEDKMSFRWSVGFRYALQVHEIITPVRAATPLYIDMQNAFCKPGAPAEVPLSRGTIDNINRLAGALRDRGGDVMTGDEFIERCI